MHTDEVFFGRWTGKLMKNTTFLLFGRNSETKRYNVIGPIGVMVVMHMATNALLTNIWAMSRDAAVMQVATKKKLEILLVG